MLPEQLVKDKYKKFARNLNERFKRLWAATKTGLKINAELDLGAYPLGKKVSNAEMDSLNIRYHGPNERWNYTIGANESGELYQKKVF